MTNAARTHVPPDRIEGGSRKRQITTDKTLAENDTTEPLIIGGVSSLLKASLVSILWFWPLRNPTHAGDPVRSRSKADPPDAPSVW
jgi:hypothetical protein